MRKILGDLRKVRELSFAVGRRRLTFANSPWPCGGCAHGLEQMEKSPYVEKPFNSKVIKSFVPALRSRKCFSCFGIPMLCYLFVRYGHYHIYQPLFSGRI